VKLELVKIRVDGGTQPRAELLIEVMEDYAEQMRNGVEFPPITVFFDGKDYWLADGFHRIGAHLRAFGDDTPVEAEVIQGTQSDAQWYSYGVNKTHGVRRNRKDVVRAIKAALLHPEGVKSSDNEIAKHVGATHPTVAKYRAELESSCEIYKMPTRKVTRGKSSYKQDTTKIGGKRKRVGDRKPSRRMASRIQKPTRAPNPMEKMTALSMPHNPMSGARTLIEVFDADYLRVLVKEISSHLKGLDA